MFKKRNFFIVFIKICVPLIDYVLFNNKKYDKMSQNMILNRFKLYVIKI